MKAWKTILIIIFGTAGAVLSLYGAMAALAFYMGSQRSCDAFNIDNIELHARINIPDIEDLDCNYDEVRTMKQAWFLIDRKSVDLEDYIRQNKLLVLTNTSQVGLADFLQPDTAITGSHFKRGDLYYATGTAARMSGVEEWWKTLLDKRSGKLWVTIYYNDKQQ